MANRNRKQKNSNENSRRLMDPIRRPQPRVSRPRLAFDGNTLHGTQFLPRMLTAAFRAATIIPIDASSINSTGLTANIGLAALSNGLTAATSIYGEYWYTNAQFTWIPHVAPGVADGGSIIYLGYIDNPEQMASIITASDASIIATIKSLKNVKTFNAWQAFTYSPALTKRLPRFNVDKTNSYLVDPTERAVQGMVLVGCESISAVADVGQLRALYAMELRNMNVTQAT